ncbi:hypothetical protein Tco_0817878 [Tanacetum coccineum]
MWNDPSFFLTNNTGALQGEGPGRIAPGIRSMRNSTSRDGGKLDRSSQNKMGKLCTMGIPSKMDLLDLIKASNPTKVKTGTRSRTAHEVPLLTTTASCVIQMENAPELSTSSGTPSTVERSPLDFLNEDMPPQMTQDAEVGFRDRLWRSKRFPWQMMLRLQ